MIHSELSPRRQRSRERRTERVVSTALQLVVDQGFDALTMARLADLLDLTPGALYRYFASKDDLVAELQARTISQLHGELREQREARQHRLPDDQARAALCELLAVSQFYLNLSKSSPRIFRLVSMTMADPRKLVTDDSAVTGVAAALADLLGEVTELFRKAECSGALNEGDAVQRTLLFWSAHHGVSLLGKLKRLAPEAIQPDQLGAALTITLLQGWGAGAEQLTIAQQWLSKQN